LNADLETVLGHISEQLEMLTNSNRGSRFLGQAADRKAVDHLADGGSFEHGSELPLGWKAVERDRHSKAGGGLTGLLRKALAVSTDQSGGYLVPPEIAREVLWALRARSVIFSMGVTTVPLKKSLDLVALSRGATASYVGENAFVPVSEETFAEQALLRPKELAALVPISDRLLRDADNPSVEEIVRRDLAEVLALRTDLAFLRGTGSGGEPRGIKNVVGLTVAPSLGPPRRPGRVRPAQGLCLINARAECAFQPARLRVSSPNDQWPGEAQGLNGSLSRRDGPAFFRPDRGLRSLAELSVSNDDADSDEPLGWLEQRLQRDLLQLGLERALGRGRRFFSHRRLRRGGLLDGD
jgi:hypothetical protein